MGRPFKQYLGGPRIYACASCGTHTADLDEIVSKARARARARGAVGLWGPGRGPGGARRAPSRQGCSRAFAEGACARAAPASSRPPPAAAPPPQAFQGRHGRAYLFSSVVNVAAGPKEDRLLITGALRGRLGAGQGWGSRGRLF
jgi:hypothetical protein